MGTTYSIINGTAFQQNTVPKVCDILNSYLHKNIRIRFYYGDSETGRCWMNEHDTIGYIGRSTGTYKIPLLIKTKNSSGGGGILDHCIVKIQVGKYTLYQHPNFSMPKVVVDACRVLFDNKVYANCHTETQASRLAAFMRGERNSK